MARKGWGEHSDFEKVKGIYECVRDEVPFGYNADASCAGAFCGYGVAVRDFQRPPVDFNRNNTYIQSEGITSDFGVYDAPDELLREHGQEMTRAKAFVYRHIGRHLMNRNVRKIRES